MMVLLVPASLIGISSMHQYLEGQTPPPATTPQPRQLPTTYVDIKGRINFVIVFPGGSCNAFVQVSGNSATQLGLPGGNLIRLGAADQNMCTSFGLANIGNTDITFDAQPPKKESKFGTRVYSATRLMF
jgi:hypothetical protein